MAYKLSRSLDGQTNGCIIRLEDNAFIPPNPANTDYQQFKKDVMDGAELRDSDGDVMSQADATEFVSNLP